MQKLKFLFIFVLIISHVNAQETYHLLKNHPGTFTVKDLKPHVGNYCGFTTKEQETYRNNLMQLVNLVKTAPIFRYQKGFDLVVTTSPGSCIDDEPYGMSCDVILLFQNWFLLDGKEIKSTIEPPNYRFILNDLNPFPHSTYSDGDADEITNTTERKQYKQAVENLNKTFYPPGEKFHYKDGIDFYGADNLVLYNPDRPDYWIPVTLQFVYDNLYNYWKYSPDVQAKDYMLNFVTTEFTKFSPQEMQGFAYYNNDVLGVCNDASHPLMMRVNPDYWDKTRPRTDLQFMSFTHPNESQWLREDLQRYEQNEDGMQYIYQFMQQIDIEKYHYLIEK